MLAKAIWLLVTMVEGEREKNLANYDNVLCNKYVLLMINLIYHHMYQSNGFEIINTP